MIQIQKRQCKIKTLPFLMRQFIPLHSIMDYLDQEVLRNPALLFLSSERKYSFLHSIFDNKI